MRFAGALVGGFAALAMAVASPDVDTRYPYTGPAIPIADWVDQTVNGNGKGFPRLVEAPAVAPASANPTNNINVITLSYLPTGMIVHYHTPFGLGVAPSVRWGTSPSALTQTAVGTTSTYDRTPPCSLVAITQCAQFFHEVHLTGLKPATTYYYEIPAANGTTASQTMTFTTARAPGDGAEFSVAVINDMGYTNAGGTYTQLLKAVDEGLAFAWHGGDISYADDWYSGILPCDLNTSDSENYWPVCYNGPLTALPGNLPIPAEYLVPLPAGEIPDQGGPQGGDMNVIYESNWDLWQNWMTNVTTKIPYMVLPGNHEAACSEFDGPNNVLTAYLNDDKANSTAPESELTYYSCPPSQRNFTAYQYRFRMNNEVSGGVSNFWGSFNYGLVHFISLTTETDFASSPSYPFVADLTAGETFPLENQTYVTDAGPFGYINGSYKTNSAYEQYQWLVKDLAAVNRTATPWVIAMGHRPMYSSQVSGYQAHIRSAWEAVMLEGGVDAYFAGHIHWYERLFPLGAGGSIDTASIVNNHTYKTNEGKSIMHIINGQAGNIESHSTLAAGKSPLNITAVLNQADYGFSKLTVFNATTLTWTFIRGNGSVGDSVTLLRPAAAANATHAATSSSVTGKATSLPSTVSGKLTSLSSSVSAKATSAASSVSGKVASTSTAASSASTAAKPATTTSASTATSTPGSTLPSGETEKPTPTAWGPWGPPGPVPTAWSPPSPWLPWTKGSWWTTRW